MNLFSFLFLFSFFNVLIKNKFNIFLNFLFNLFYSGVDWLRNYLQGGRGGYDRLGFKKVIPPPPPPPPNLVFSETLGNIEPFLIPGPHHENVKDMQIINYRVYVDSSYYNVHKFRKSLF